MNTFKSGDVVQLKSGSRLMTVVHVNDDGRIAVAYDARRTSALDSQQGIARDVFPPDALALVQSSHSDVAVGSGVALTELECQ